MKKILTILILSSFLFNCKSDDISESEKKEIIIELDLILAIDQEYAGMPPKELMETHGHKKAWAIFKNKRDSIGLINQKKIKLLYKKYGYLGHKEIGKNASSNFWISIQHADNDVEFQQEMLSALKKEIEKDNANRADYAMLEDRVNVNLNKPQRFGSQVTYNDYGQAVPKNGLVDSTNIEKLRREFNLPSFKDYYNDMTKSHFEMNKELFLKNGIKAPELYK